MFSIHLVALGEDRPTPPGKALVAMTLGKSVTLTWAPPDDDGGCKIGNYIVEYYRVGVIDNSLLGVSYIFINFGNGV